MIMLYQQSIYTTLYKCGKHMCNLGAFLFLLVLVFYMIMAIMIMVYQQLIYTTLYKCGKHMCNLGAFLFLLLLVFYILWAHLIKQLPYSDLRDVRWLYPNSVLCPTRSICNVIANVHAYKC